MKISKKDLYAEECMNTVRQSKFFRAALISVILAGLVWWNPQSLFYPVRLVFSTIALPFERVFSVIGFRAGGAQDFLGSIGELKQENERLTHENIRLMAENAKTSDIQKENEVLRSQLDLAPRKDFKLEAADVIGQDAHGSGNWIMINKGTSDGLKKGMPVIVDHGSLVGRIDEVSSQSSRVMLLMNPESVINGVDAQTEAKGIVRGQYGLGLVLDMVLQTDTVSEGNDIVSSGLGGDLPRGLFLGKVREVHPSPDRLFQQAVLTSPVHPEKLRIVFVVIDTAF